MEESICAAESSWAGLTPDFIPGLIEALVHPPCRQVEVSTEICIEEVPLV
jgi:hypothetical protein